MTPEASTTPEVPRQRPVSERTHGVCVIGGAGFVGSLLVERLLDEGYSVCVLDALMYGDDGIRHVIGREGFSLVRGDLRQVESVVRACRGADAVVHLGALVGDPACELDEKLTLEVNRDATATAAAVARGLGIDRFVFASTCSVYGASDDLISEESALRPISVYARSKMESEQLLLESRAGDFCPVILRFGTLFGQSRRERFDLVVNLLAAKAVTDGEITIQGGTQWRPFVHVADVVEAIVLALKAPAAAVDHQVLNVGSDEGNHTLAQVAQTVADVVAGVRIVQAPAAAQEANYRVSFARIRETLGFRPSRTLADGVAEIAAAVRRGAVEDYTHERHSNYRSLVSGTAALDSLGAAVVGAPAALA